MRNKIRISSKHLGFRKRGTSGGMECVLIYGRRVSAVSKQDTSGAHRPTSRNPDWGLKGKPKKSPLHVPFHAGLCFFPSCDPPVAKGQRGGAYARAKQRQALAPRKGPATCAQSKPCMHRDMDQCRRVPAPKWRNQEPDAPGLASYADCCVAVTGQGGRGSLFRVASEQSLRRQGQQRRARRAPDDSGDVIATWGKGHVKVKPDTNE